MMEKIIKSGDKIDIKYLHQNNEKTYMSNVYDVLNEDELEITIPTDGGRIILFQNGFELQFFFHTARGMYTCDAVVRDRYKRNNTYLLLIEVLTPLKKFQRREYFRFQCNIDFVYYKLTEDVAELETTREIVEIIAKPENLSQRKLARTKDLSGGGCRFLTKEPLKTGEKILSVIHLTNEKLDRLFYLVTEIVTCEETNPSKEIWTVRGRFEFKDIKERDCIVQYVFEEDRRLRKKESGK